MEDLEKALRPILVNIASAGAIFQRHEDTFRERLRLKVEEFQKNGLLKDIRYDATPEQQSKRQRTKESLLSPAVVKNINSELNAAASKQNTRSKKSSLLSENQEEDFKPPKSKENDSSRLNVPAGYRKSRANSDDSVIVLGSNEKEVVELSDDETSAMPPPPAPPAKNKRTARTKKRSESQDSTDMPLRITRSRIKKEKISVAGSSTMVSTETDTATTDLIPKCVVKVERLSNITKATTKNAKDKTKRQSAESVYEDAASEMADPVDSLPSTTFNVPKSDAAVDDITTAISNTTITLSSDQVMNETYQMPRTENTFTMNKENDGIQSPSEIANSIMTDDLSYEEEIAVTKKPLGKAAQLKKKELFNPFEQSPVKQKVAAFEKIAQSGVKNVEGSANGKQRSVIPKMAITPIKHTVVTKPSTPLNQVYTSIVKSSSSSKLAHLQKIHSASKGCASTGKIGSASSSQPLSREHSAEDVRRGLAEKAEEKKKKRELKQAQVQQQREAREQEKLLKHKKALEEKEEKLRQDAERRKLAKEKKAIEMERKRQLEEINRNLRMEEARREEHLRSEEQNRLEKELLKQMAKAKIEESSSADITNPILKQQIKDFNRDKHPEYDFHMLRSDDETDDEDQPQASNKRPPPPDWSRSSNRKKELMKQQYCASPIVDTFFGVQPRTANLLELFPTIDPKYLKRNSSAIWNTSID